MHKGKVITINPYRIQPFTQDLEIKHDKVVSGLMDLFSRDEVTKHNPQRKIRTHQEADMQIFDSIKGYESGLSYNYFMFDLERDRMIGLISAISPQGLRHAYPVLPLLPSIKNDNSNVWMLEYYLHPEYWNLGLMTIFCGTLMNNLFGEGASLVTALVNEDNISSQKMLGHLLFEKNTEYKDTQNQILFTRNRPISLRVE